MLLGRVDGCFWEVVQVEKHYCGSSEGPLHIVSREVSSGPRSKASQTCSAVSR